ncbi:MAG: lactonase family protein [Chitinophagaceae bacterium]
MKKILLLLAAALFFIQGFSQTDKSYYMLAGTYTSGKSKGIYVYKFNTADGSVEEISTASASNPSFLAVSPDEKFVYSVYEDATKGKGGDVAAYAFDKQTGKLTFINRQPSGGDHPCFVAVDKTGKWVTAGNYSSGSLSLLPIEEDGSIGMVKTHIEHNGSGIDKSRQASPHVHSTFFTPDNNWLLVPDLGIDKVMIYNFEAATGTLTPGIPAFAKVTDGAGPRHLDFSPSHKYVYLIEEMGGNVVVYKYKNGELTPVQRVSALPDGFKGTIGSADIHVSPDGRFVYASNRGSSNNIAIFKVNPRNGKLSMFSLVPTGGITPRNFSIDPSGKFLLVANQNSDNIVIFKRDVETGHLTATGKQISIPNPVCIKWINP